MALRMCKQFHLEDRAVEDSEEKTRGKKLTKKKSKEKESEVSRIEKDVRFECYRTCGSRDHRQQSQIHLDVRLH